MNVFRKFLRDNRGVSFIEFNIIMALVIVSWMSATATLGSKASQFLDQNQNVVSVPVVNNDYKLDLCSATGIYVPYGGTIGNLYNQKGIELGYYGTILPYHVDNCHAYATQIEMSLPERYQIFNGSSKNMNLPFSNNVSGSGGVIIPAGFNAILFLQDGLSWDGIDNPIWAVFPGNNANSTSSETGFIAEKLAQVCKKDGGTLTIGQKMSDDAVCYSNSGSAPVYNPKILNYFLTNKK